MRTSTIQNPAPAATRTGPVVIAEDLVKVYPGGVRAVDGVSFTIEPGEAFGLLGPNGAGKSTTIGMLNTTVVPTAGRAFIAGRDVAREPIATRAVCSVVFQDPVVDLTLSGRQNLNLHLQLWRVPPDEGSRRLAELSDLVGIAGILDRPVSTYSGGQRRRLEIVRALVSRRSCSSSTSQRSASTPGCGTTCSTPSPP